MSNRYQKCYKNYGKRSGLEIKFAEQLDDNKLNYGYETEKIKYTITSSHTYTPDFVLTNKKGCVIMFIETKGYWSSEDRLKMKTIKTLYPELDIRMVFANKNKTISKKSKTTYEAYCNKIGIPCSQKEMPIEWIEELREKYNG